MDLICFISFQLAIFLNMKIQINAKYIIILLTMRLLPKIGCQSTCNKIQLLTELFETT
jgi:hypothetical protein